MQKNSTFRKLIAVACILLGIMMLASCGNDTTEPPAENITWRVDSDTLHIGGTGEMPDYFVDNMPWTKSLKTVSRIEVAEGVTTLGRCAFYGAANLTEVKLPASLTKIDEYAFSNCPLLASVNIPAGVAKIESYAFRNCPETLKLDFETKYGWSAGKINLTATEISHVGAKLISDTYRADIWTRDENAAVEEVDPNYAESGRCNASIMWTLTYTDSTKETMKLTVEGSGAMPNYGTAATPWYQHLNKIVEVEVTEGITSLGRCAFHGLKMVRKATLCDGITTIGDYAFSNCLLLKEIAIPSTVTEISETAFEKTGIPAIDATVAHVGTCGNDVMWALTYTDETKTDMKLTIAGTGAMNNYGTGTAPWYQYLDQIVEIEVAGVTEIGRCAFNGLKMVRNVTLYEGLTTIGDYAFSNCLLLKEIAIPSTVTEISETAFEKTGIPAIDATVAHVGTCGSDVMWALTYTDETKTAMKLTVYGTGAIADQGTGTAPWYQYLDNIVEVEVTEGITEIGRCAFYGLKFVTTVTLPSTLTIIGDYAFNGCFSLNSIEIPESVTKISETAFTKTGLSELPTV